MKQLVLLQNNQAVTTSLQVAETFKKQHKHVLEAIDELKKVVENSADLFNESSYQHPQNKQNYRMFYMNRDGFTLLAMGFTGKEAIQFKLKYIDAFNRMEQAVHQPKALSEKEQLKASMRLSLETSEEVEVLKLEVNELKEKVDNQITLDHGEQRRLQRLISTKVHEYASSDDHKRLLFPELYREIKDRFGVSSYKDVKRHELQSAIKYIESWIPRKRVVDVSG